MLRLVSMAIGLLALSGCISDLPPDVSGPRIIAELKAASGGAALDQPSGFHETGTLIRDGKPATYETWGDFKTMKTVSTMTVDGHAMTNGYDGNSTWATDPSGAVRTDASPQALASARLGAYLTIGGYFYPDRFPARFVYDGPREWDYKTFDVVTVTPEGALPVDLWIDRTTHLLQRVSGEDGAESFYAGVLRYKVIDGVQIPFELAQVQGSSRIQQTLTSYTFETVPPEKFAPPAR
ncbi:MAG TPA: hypothetical protein VG942_12575 [Hyphomonadaceae bacterium]|nr:hypothetical protein [Hyphomonadaceae bacterium]